MKYTNETKCIQCGNPATEEFFCPCDLFHAICEPCRDAGAHLDCAFILADLKRQASDFEVVWDKYAEESLRR